MQRPKLMLALEANAAKEQEYLGNWRYGKINFKEEGHGHDCGVVAQGLSMYFQRKQ